MRRLGLRARIVVNIENGDEKAVAIAVRNSWGICVGEFGVSRENFVPMEA